MEQARKNWNDDRLDALASRMDERFAEVDRRFEEVNQRFDRFESHVEHRFNSIDASLQQIHRSMFIGMATFAGALVSLVALRF
jgi:fido (protein-threonine AMPylation protein)